MTADIVLPRQLAADAAIAALVVDRIDPDAVGLGRIVVQMEHAQAAASAAGLRNWLMKLSSR